MKKRRRVPFFRSIQTKYALTYIVVIAAVLAFMNIYPVLKVQDLIYQSKQTSLQSQSAVIASALAGLESLTPEGVAQVMNQLEGGVTQPMNQMDETGVMSSTRIIVTDGAGMILFDTLEGGGTLYRYALTREVAYALSGNDVFDSIYTDGRFQSRAALPVVYRNMNIGAVLLYEEDLGQGALLQSIQSNLRSMSLGVGVAVLVISFIFSKALTRRVGALLRAIRIVREGEYSHRVKVKGGDELAQLADEFNQLTDRLQTTDEVRRRFVSDASHELKTPLASIRLLSDSILHSDHIDLDTTREFVTDIGEEAERLTRISEKLLTLTRLDAQQEVERAPVDLGEVLKKVEHMLVPLARVSGITLERETEDGCLVYATEDDLYQIAFNLVENGIKYNLPGGRVEVASVCRDGRVVITVTDTGVGIPAQDMDKIFDRFYRVDKARSRAAGGTGLGLSIARDAARLHGGDIKASPNPAGQGARFEAQFPVLTEGEKP